MLVNAKKNAVLHDGRAFVCSKLDNGNYEIVLHVMQNYKTRDMNITQQRMQEMVDNFNNSLQKQILFDYDHLSWYGESSKAAGWGVKLEIRNNELICEMKPTESGRQAIESKEYQYVSTVILFRWQNHITGEIYNTWKIDSVALTNIPFIEELPAITNEKGDFMNWWTALGYASEEEALTKIKADQQELINQRARVSKLEADLKSANEANSAMQKQMNEAIVNSDIQAKKLLPAFKETALTLINSSKAEYDKFVSSNTGLNQTNLGKETTLQSEEEPGGSMTLADLRKDPAKEQAFAKSNPVEYEKMLDEHIKNGGRQ